MGLFASNSSADEQKAPGGFDHLRSSDRLTVIRPALATQSIAKRRGTELMTAASGSAPASPAGGLNRRRRQRVSGRGRVALRKIAQWVRWTFWPAVFLGLAFRAVHIGGISAETWQRLVPVCLLVGVPIILGSLLRDSSQLRRSWRSLRAQREKQRSSLSSAPGLSNARRAPKVISSQ